MKPQIEVPPSLPVGWLETVTLEGSVTPVRVILDGRGGGKVFVRQADPADGDDLPRVAVYEGESLSVMTAISHISHNLSPEPGEKDSFLFSQRVVPVRREPGIVYARTVRHGEPDNGDRVHVREGESLTFEPGAVAAELEAIDAQERQGAQGYVPLTPVLWAWMVTGTGTAAEVRRYLWAAARRLDQASDMFTDLRALRDELTTTELPGPVQRRMMFRLIGKVEVAVVVLSRAIDMALKAPALIGTIAPLPPKLNASRDAITALRNAYEHIEDRALGRANNKPHPDAITIFSYQTLLENNAITYASHSLHLDNEVPELIEATREYLKAVAGDAIPAVPAVP